MRIQTVPAWRTLVEADGEEPAVMVLCAPVSRPMIERAWKAAGEAALAENAEPGDAQEAFGCSILCQAILDWSGIGDMAGAPLAFTPEHLAVAIINPELGDLATREIVAPVVLREMEKNGLALSPAGTSPATPGTAGAPPSAEQGIATPAPAATPAPEPAPTRSAPRSRTKARPSGV
jgi:hypothetical protein